MADPTTPLIKASFYEPSAKIPAAGAAIALAVAGPGAVGAGLVYAYADYYSPLVWGNVLLVGCFGYAVGYVTARGAFWGKIRSPSHFTQIGVFAAIAGYFAAWIVWLNVIAGNGRDTVGLGWMLLHPASFWHVIEWAYANGTWSVGSHFQVGTGLTPSVNGPFLVLVWIGEAVAFFAAAIVTSRLRSTNRAYCEACGCWIGPPKTLHSYRGDASVAEIKLRLVARDWEYLGALAPARYSDISRAVLTHESCSRCGTNHLLSLTRVSIFREKYGKHSSSTIPVMNRMIVSTEEVEWIRSLSNGAAGVDA